MHAPGFGLIPFRSSLLRESLLISFPPGTEIFQFPGLAPFQVIEHYLNRVSPFGHLRIKTFYQFPVAFRR